MSISARFRRSRATVLRLLLALALSSTLASCTIGEVKRPEASSTTTVVGPTSDSSTGAPGLPESEHSGGSGQGGYPAAVAERDLNRIVAQVEKETGARVGLGVDDVVAGRLTSGPAWSTIKVPLAIATVNAAPGHDVEMERAITASDNASADAMWQALGGGERAASQVTTVLADGGDAETRVQPEAVRPGFSPYGQTEWALNNQLRFARSLQKPEATEVFAAMARAQQRYGLASLPAAHVKAGWGPDESGAYLVRQFGLAEVQGRLVPVAAMVVPADGTYESGQNVLSSLAELLRQL